MSLRCEEKMDWLLSGQLTDCVLDCFHSFSFAFYCSFSDEGNWKCCRTMRVEEGDKARRLRFYETEQI
jgi:hypothetical protein